jgi:hypothetical protein
MFCNKISHLCSGARTSSHQINLALTQLCIPTLPLVRSYFGQPIHSLMLRHVQVGMIGCKPVLPNQQLRSASLRLRCSAAPNQQPSSLTVACIQPSLQNRPLLVQVLGHTLLRSFCVRKELL